MHSVYWWRAVEFEAESARHARGKKDSRVLPQTPIASVVQACNYCQLQLLPLSRFEYFRTATNCSKFALKSASHCCDNEHDKRELNIFLISEFGGSRRLRAGITDRSFWFVFVFLLHTTDRTQRTSRVGKMHLLFQ